MAHLPPSLHSDPITMTLLARIVRGLQIDASTLALGGRPLSEHEPFVKALSEEDVAAAAQRPPRPRPRPSSEARSSVGFIQALLDRLFGWVGAREG